MAGDLSTSVTTPNGIKYEQPTGLYINGEFVKSKSGKTFKVENPATEEAICEVYEADEEDVNIAVEAAEKAFEKWSVIDPTVRGELLYKFADKIEENLETLAAIESMNNGKSLPMATGDITLVVKVLRNYAGWANKVYGDVVETGETHFTYTRREPLGVCGQIIAWNFPLLLWSWKVGPALATGNTVVIKTAEATPLSALFAAKLATEVGIPAGVLNIISGYGKTGAAISSHMKIKKVAFTGSTATGRHIMRAAATSNLKKVTLELGGKSPHIIFNDANLDEAIEAVKIGIYFNSGEVCCAGSRLYVQEDIYDAFIEKVKTMAEKTKPGDPFDKETYYGPQTSKIQLDRVLSYIDEGKKEGARVVTGGKRVDRKGYFIEPTIFADVRQDMKIVQEEIFGPVVTISKFKTVEDVLQLAHDTDYGLAAGLHTRDISKAIYVANALKAGTIWVNTYNDFHAQVPFGGYGQSGMGREMGKEALDAYTQTKAVRIGNISAGKF